MFNFFIRRLGLLAVTLFGISLLIFGILQLLPGVFEGGRRYRLSAWCKAVVGQRIMHQELPNPTQFKDGRGRPISYLRLSITDRCNLACFYCRQENAQFIPHESILRYEEMLALAEVAKRMRIDKIRLTGGEPFARKGFMGFLGRLAKACPDADLRITTNATLLAGRARELARIGVKRLNISLDSLAAENFAKITGQAMLPKVLAGIEESLSAGIRVKVNTVGLKGLNDAELPAFLDLARELDIEVRFIEYMPIGAETRWTTDYFWPSEDILTQARELTELTPIHHGVASSGPARVFALAGGRGRVGVISALTNHFCATCNRVRITSDGRLRPCLFSDREYRLRPLLRHPKLGPEACLKVIRLALASKPVGHEILEARRQASVCGRGMSAIGG